MNHKVNSISELLSLVAEVGDTCELDTGLRKKCYRFDGTHWEIQISRRK